LQKAENYVVPLGEDKNKTPEQLEAERKTEQDLIDNGGWRLRLAFSIC
jgi:hypothetical protein